MASAQLIQPPDIASPMTHPVRYSWSDQISIKVVAEKAHQSNHEQRKGVHDQLPKAHCVGNLLNLLWFLRLHSRRPSGSHQALYQINAETTQTTSTLPKPHIR